MNAQIELTAKCNARCGFCSIWHEEFQNNLEPEMTTKEVKFIIDGLSRLGVMTLSLTGGEPTLRPDLSEIATYASKRGMMPTMATNGAILENLLEQGKLEDMEWIMVSIDFPDAERHDENRGIKVFDRAVRGIKAAVKLGKLVVISTVVTKDNIQYMEEMCKLAMKWGTMIELLPCEDIIREQEEEAHVVDEAKSFIPDLGRWADEIRRLSSIYPNLTTDKITASVVEAGGFGNQDLLHCVVAKSFIMIGYNGELLLPCKIHPLLKIDVTNTPVDEVYNTYEARRIMDIGDGFPFCKGCRLGCAIATSIPEHWNTVYEKYVKAFFNGVFF